MNNDCMLKGDIVQTPNGIGIITSIEETIVSVYLGDNLGLYDFCKTSVHKVVDYKKPTESNLDTSSIDMDIFDKYRIDNAIWTLLQFQDEIENMSDIMRLDRYEIEAMFRMLHYVKGTIHKDWMKSLQDRGII